MVKIVSSSNPPSTGGKPGIGAAPVAGKPVIELTPEKKAKISSTFQFYKNLGAEAARLGSYTASFIQNGSAVPLKLMSMARNVTKATSHLWDKTHPVYKGIAATKYLSVINLPFSI